MLESAEVLELKNQIKVLQDKQRKIREEAQNDFVSRLRFQITVENANNSDAVRKNLFWSLDRKQNGDVEKACKMLGSYVIRVFRKCINKAEVVEYCKNKYDITFNDGGGLIGGMTYIWCNGVVISLGGGTCILNLPQFCSKDEFWDYSVGNRMIPREWLIKPYQKDIISHADKI